MKKWFIFLAMTVCSAAQAQQNYFYLNWDYNMPLSNTEWLESASARGGKIGYRLFIADGKFSAGLDVNWTTFDEYAPRTTFPQTNGTITTDYFKYIYNYGAVISGQYYFPLGEHKRVLPYVGVGLGANYNEYVLYYNIYQDSYKGWGFLGRPEAGILFRFGTRRSLGAMAAIHYDYSTNTNDEFNYSNFSTVGFQLGIMMMGW